MIISLELRRRIENLAENLEGHAGHLLQSPFNINKQLDAAAPYNAIAWELRQLLINDE